MATYISEADAAADVPALLTLVRAGEDFLITDTNSDKLVIMGLIPESGGSVMMRLFAQPT